MRAAAIHGSRTQPQRDRALWAFQPGRVRALVATDVAARGIHVDDVSCVVHFDPPSTDKDYVHRSGRTGRAGADGTVVSLVGRENHADVRAIQKALKMPQRIDSPNLGLANTHVPTKPRGNGHDAPMPTTNGHAKPARANVSSAARRRNPNKPWRGQKSSGASRGRRPQRESRPR